MLCTYCNIIPVYMYVMHVIITNPWDLYLTFYFTVGTCVCTRDYFVVNAWRIRKYVLCMHGMFHRLRKVYILFEWYILQYMLL